jgi:dipeptidyl aminopeptidase/acylaminoacyl peptidase
MTDERRVVAEDLFRLRFVGDPRVSPDGARVAFVTTTLDEERNDYRSRIWLVAADGSGEPRPLTSGTGKDTSPRWSPDGRRLAFVSDREPTVRPEGLAAGDPAKPQIWVLDLAGGEARQVTAAKQGAADPAWSPDGRQLVFTAQTGGDDEAAEAALAGKPQAERAKERADRVKVITSLKYKFDGIGYLWGRKRHLFAVGVPEGDVAPAEARQLTDGPWNDGAPAWSPDGREIAFVSYREADEDVTFRSDIWVLSVADGAYRKLTGSKGSSASPAWSPDGRQIAYFGHTEGEGNAAMTRLWVVDADGSAAPRCVSVDFDRDLGGSTLTDQTLPGGNEGPTWTTDGASVLALVSDGGAVGLRRFRVNGGEPWPVIGSEQVVTAFSVSNDGARLAFGLTTATAPAELFAIDSEGERSQLTALNAAWLASRDVAQPEAFRFAGMRGDAIDGWLLRPPGAGDSPAPLIVQLHGGPHAQYGWTFFHEFQVLAGRGYAVFYCNPHGGTGRGDAFAKALLRDWGTLAMGDVMAGLEAALARGGLDADRLAVTGGSYGGFLTNWITCHTTRFKAAVTQRSYCNAMAYFGVDDIGAITDVAELGGHPWEIPEAYLALSPIMHVGKVATPTLIEHQELDYRCPLSQAEQWYAALKKRGVPTKLIIYPNESHGMSRNGKPRHRMERLAQNVGWFDEWLT